MPGHFSNQVYKMVLDRAKDLLTTLHLKVLEAEKLIEERIGPNSHHLSQMKGDFMGSSMGQGGFE